jgi:tetratricopeptide (TPR) repeat protein
MIEQVVTAFENQDYKKAAKLLKPLLKESSQEHLVLLYYGKLQEVFEKYEEAEKIYRKLLRNTTIPKIVTQARQGLQRLEEIKQQQRENAILEATADPRNTETGVLVLEPVINEKKIDLAPQFAKIMQLDAYTARLTLPSRGWRLYKTGAVGELEYFGQKLRQAGIPCFWAKLKDVQKIQVFQVNHFQAASPKAIAVCQNQENQLGHLTFDWKEVKAKVLGQLPIFEDVIDRDTRGKLQRKTEIKEYFHFCDLHIPGRNCILRLYDNGYQYQEGLEIAPLPSQNPNRINWNHLQSFLDQSLTEIPVYSDFSPFKETVLDYGEMLGKIHSHIHLFRKDKTNWDAAFHLYSALVFLQ